MKRTRWPRVLVWATLAVVPMVGVHGQEGPVEDAPAGEEPVAAQDVPVPEGWKTVKRKVETVTEEGTVVEKEITYYVNSQGMEFVWVPPGEFMMGSPANEEGRDDDETQHRVKLTKGFFMGATEVTQSQYETLMGSNLSYFKGTSNPVEQVSWHDAEKYCESLTKKDGVTYGLPTEAQWEYACRAGTKTPFNCGETISTDLANYDGNYTYGDGRKGTYREKTTPVRSFPANAWGLYDMHGNVWEWCVDWYGEDYYEKSDKEDAKGPNSGTDRVLRGGSWNHRPRYCRSANRVGGNPALTFFTLGFRLVYSPR